MREKIFRLLHVSVLSGLAALIAVLLRSGKLSYYINERFNPLIIAGEFLMIVFILIGSVDFLLESGVIRINQATGRPEIIQVGLTVLILMLAFLGFFLLSEIMVIAIFIGINLAGLVVIMQGIDEKFEQENGLHNQNMLNIIILFIPFVLGFFVPASPLETASIQTKGITTSAAPLSSANLIAIEKEAETMDILDWLQAVNSLDDPSLLNGETVNAIGFVYRNPELDDDQFMISRFVMTCCAADAFAVGMVVEWPNAIELAEDLWVEIEGKAAVDDSGENRMIIVQADSVAVIDQPLQPYIFP